MPYRIIMMIVLLASLMVPVQTAPLSAAPPRPLGHCNEDAVALGLGGGAVPNIINKPLPLSMAAALPIPINPQNPDWFMIYVERGHTVVFYTENVAQYPDFAIIDKTSPISTTAGNADLNRNIIPDYAERTLACFDTAFERLNEYFKPTLSARAAILHLNTGDFRTHAYPVILKKEIRRGTTQPIFQHSYNSRNPLPYSTIEAQGGILETETDPTGANLDRSGYPALETIAFHELYHAFQGILAAFEVSPSDPFAVENYWAYESTAVYATD